MVLTSPDPPPSVPPAEKQSPGTKAWVAHRVAARAAADADRADAATDRAEKEREIERDYDHPAGIWIGLAVIAVLLVVSLLVIKQMGCDPLFSDRALSRSCN